MPFDGLQPALDTSHVQWALTSMAAEPPGVAFRVPGGFGACLRIHHALSDGRRWSDVVPELLVPGAAPLPPFTGPAEVLDGDGNLGDDVVDLLVPILAAATTTPESCHYGLWNGRGGLSPGSSVVMTAWAGRRRPWTPLSMKSAQRRAQREYEDACRPAREFVARCPLEQRWGGRHMLLFDGAIDAVAAIGTPGTPTIHRLSPQWWWPDDRAWFLGTEVDDAWTYLAGPESLIETVEVTDLETVRVGHGDLW